MSDGGSYVAELATNDPAGRTIEVQLRPRRRGRDRARRRGARRRTAGRGGRDRLRGAAPDERFLGFGERSNAVDQRGNVVENYVADGPYQRRGVAADRRRSSRPGDSAPREDATYYPVPWLLSSRGYGVLVDNPETSYFRLDQAGSWSVEVERAARRAGAGRRPRARA